jgi:sigma-B regulation protein RsbU (phosphoserine phosphatase)
MRINIKESLALKLSLYIITTVVIIFVSVLVYNYFISKELILENNEENISNLEKWKLNQIDQYISGVQDLVENLTLVMENSDETGSELLDILKKMVERCPEVYGSTIAYEPYMFSKDKYYFAPYFYKKGNILQYKDIGSPEYDYFKMDWYSQPKKLNRGVWGDPYFDEGGGDILMVSYGLPFYKRINGKRVLCGVIDGDISLDWLVKLISKTKVFKTGYTFVLSNKGIFLAHPNKDYYTKGKSFLSLAKEYNSPIHKKIGENMISGQIGVIRYYSFSLGKNCYVYYRPLNRTGWSLGIVIPEDELFSKLDFTTLKLFIIGIIGYLLTLVLVIVLLNRAIPKFLENSGIHDMKIWRQQ